MLLSPIVVMIISYVCQAIAIGYFIGKFIRAKSFVLFMLIFTITITVGYALTNYIRLVALIPTLIILVLLIIQQTTISKVVACLYPLIGFLSMMIISFPIEIMLIKRIPGAKGILDVSPVLTLVEQILSFPILIIIWMVVTIAFQKIFKMDEAKGFRQYLPFIIVETIMIFALENLILVCVEQLELYSMVAVMLVFISVLILNCLMIITANNLNKAHEKELRLAEAEALVQAQKQSYLQYQERNVWIRRLRHDMSNQLQIIRYLLESGQKDKAIEQLQAYHDAVEKSQNVIYSGNTIVDAVINMKRPTIEEAGIQFQFDGRLPSDLSIDSVALSSITSNILDNAIHGCSVVRENARRIELTVKFENHRFVMKCVNTCEEGTEIPTAENVSLSSEHGWGTQIMRHYAEMFSGDVVYDVEGRTFCSIVYLLIEE